MNRITNLVIVLFFFASTLLVGCSREELLIPDISSKVELLPDGSLRIPLTLNPVLPQVQEVQTRTSYSNTEERIESVYVLVFEATDDQPLPDGARLLQNVRAVAGGHSQAYVTFAPYAGKCQLRVLTNLSSDVVNTLNAFQTVDENPTTPTTFAQFKDVQFGINAFYNYVTNPGTVTNPPYTMSSDRIYLESISPETTNSLTANLFMGAARIDISVDPSVVNFNLNSATLLNGAQRGYLRPRPLGELPVNLGGTVEYTEVYPIGGKISPIYLLENNGALTSQAQGTNATYLILKADLIDELGYQDKRYFKLVVRYDKEGADHYDIVRNTLYDIRITAVRNLGYERMEDAIANSPANIEYDITVNDGTSADIVVGNGQYYMGLSNSEVLYYAEPLKAVDTEEVVLATLTLGTAPGQPLPSASIRTITTDAWGGEMELITTSADLNVAAGVAVEIKAKILKQNIDNKVIIRIGNLVKTIRVQSKDRIVSLDNNFIAVNNVVQAMVSHNSDNNFLRIATTNNSYPATYTPELRNSSPSTVYLCVPPSSSTLRTAEVYLSRAGDEGRIKAIVEQKMMDPSAIITSGISDAYVGAFWRAWQTGERIIRIQTDSGKEGAWDAQVIWHDDSWGDDKVLFSTDPTKDSNVSFTNSGISAADMNRPENDILFNVNGGASFASGTTTRDGYIYFRMGISKENYGAKPRYAVVLLRFADLTKNYLIYLRQGEQADAVSHNSNVEWLPYNVGNYANPTEYPYAQTGLTAYPTQAGYFKKMTHLSDMCEPSAPNVTVWNESAASPIVNVCPSGYKIPTSNGTNSNTVALIMKGEANEMGSLFNATNAGLFKRTFGYYADGFFDRHAKVEPKGGSTSPNSAIKIDNASIAYRGYLYVSSNTYASVFFPAAGYRDYRDGRLLFAGTAGDFFSSSIVDSSTKIATLFFGPLSTKLELLNIVNNHGFSIRCIRQ